ncbi:MAG: hypothetical protein AAF292_17100 [Pseudomonadota bacterium]
MSLSTTEAVQEVHRLALQQSVSRILGTEQEWSRFNTIVREAAERVDAEKADFRHDYQTRLAEARQVILREQSKHTLEHPTPTGIEKAPPSPERIDIMAINRVQADHERRIAAIRQDEVDGYRGLSATVREREAREAHARDRHKGHARDRFNLANQQSPYLAKARTRSGPTQ